nr:phage integrase N-terminal SAM-like domain-containing protein [Sinorhizobium medicae]
MKEISPLRRRMIDDMTVRNLSPATQRSYLHAVTKFSRHFGRSPDRLGLRAFQVHLLSRTTTSLARSSLTNWVRGLACVPTIQKASDPSNVTETCLYEMACGSETGEPPNRSYCA